MSGTDYDDEFEIWLRGKGSKVHDEIFHDRISVLQPRPPVVVAPSSTVRECVDLLVKHRVGCVLVLDDGVMVGIFTERDVLTKVVAPGLDPEGAAIADVMTARPDCLVAHDRLVVALNRMVVGGYRHMPVVNEAGEAVGVVSLRRVVQFIVSQYPDEIINRPQRETLKHPSRINGG